MMKLKAWHAIVAGAVLVGALLSVIARTSSTEEVKPVVFTVGDVRAVHAQVFVGKREVRGTLRISDGETIKTGADGRARVRLDDGTLIAVDGGTDLVLKGNRLSLNSGRIFVQGGKAARSEVSLGAASTNVSGSAIAFERRGNASKVYCANGELMLSALGRQTRLLSGETASIDDREIKVVPEKAFDDWTGGLAVPWSGPLGEKSAIPEVRAGNGGTDPGSPLVVRSQHINVRIDGEVAVTRTRTVYFNGSDTATQAHVRLALPANAILTRVSRSMGPKSTRDAQLVIAREGPQAIGALGLQWAGGSWLQGNLGGVGAGETLELLLEYTEWLSTRSGRSTYRFPMASGDDAGLIGELDAQIDTTKAHSPFLSASAGATVKDGVVKLRAADFRPKGDLVVELAPRVVRSGAARAYVMNGRAGEDPYLMVRTEVPEKQDFGITLALVVDASMSVGAATLETERAVVDAILEGLGPRDSVAVFALDQGVRALGPSVPTSVTKALRSEIQSALGALRPGGASNIGLGLQTAADVLDAPSRGEIAGSGMVVYIGDGQPSVGETNAERIRRLIARRGGGMPRLSAIAVGPGADRWLLAKLTTGAGSVYEVLDRSDASRAGAALLADALEPTLRDVALDLGPNVDRIFPREAHAALAGSTVTVLGRLRGKLPSRIEFQFRNGRELVKESRTLHATPLPEAADVKTRWAQARIEEMAARDEGIEPAIALAAQAKLLTPWTSWSFENTAEVRAPPFKERVLELSPMLDTPFAARIDDIVRTESTLLEPARDSKKGVSLAEAAALATRRILKQAASGFRACRDARAAVRPEVASQFSISLSVSGEGFATNVRVVLMGSTGPDPVLERCIKGVVESLRYFAAGVAVTVTESLTLPVTRAARRTQCSEASKVALPIRKMIWRARQDLDADAYVTAAQACELASWTDRRAFLMLILERTTAAEARLELASNLEIAGETDAATFVRKETLRRVSSFSELEALRRILLAEEPEIDAEFDKAYQQTNSDEQRLDVVRRFLRLAPHNSLARRRLLALLEALGKRDTLIQEIATIRAESFVDAGLLSHAASTLRRIGLDLEGRRAFGELIERAPRDPWTLAYVGDKLRAEGLFDEATSAYASLAALVPNDAAVILRMALAHAGAGRLDVATRLLDRVTQTGGRGDDGRLGELASITQAVLLADARIHGAPDALPELERRLARTPLPDVASLIMIEAAPSDDPLEIRIAREGGERAEQSADLDARSLGLSAIRIERGALATRIILSRRSEKGPSPKARARVSALVLGEHASIPKLVLRDVEVAANGTPTELRFDGGTLL